MKTDSRDSTKLTDKELLALFARSRNEDAFAELIARHGPMVLRVCQQLLVSEQDAEDAFQAVFLVLARKAGSVAWHSSIANWLYGVAWRISRRATRRTAKRIERSCDMEDFADNNEQSSTAVDVAEQLLYPALYKLGAKYREPIVLCHLQGKTRSEAAEALGVTESVVKGRLERGREMLRKLLAKEGVATLSLLASGLLASRIAHSAIPSATSISLIRASTVLASGTSSVSVSANSINLAKREVLQMMITFQVKLAAIILGLTCAAGTGVLLVAQTTSPSKSGKAENEVPVAEWKQLDATQRDMLTKSNLNALVKAVHQYVDDHNGMLPPAAVPNPNLSMEKRLSGFVLLLPYLNEKQLYDSIDLTKAWDDPANAKAAKAIVATFLSPEEDVFFDSSGFAVSHFAFVRGSRGRDNGMFPLVDQAQLAIPDINDGTSATLAAGQIHSDFGPWLAAGPSTARFFNPPGVKAQTPGFGSKHAGAAYVANGDSYTYFWDMSASKLDAAYAIAGRDDSILFDSNDLARYDSATEWMRTQQREGSAK